jgi:hypothetical protein
MHVDLVHTFGMVSYCFVDLGTDPDTPGGGGGGLGGGGLGGNRGGGGGRGESVLVSGIQGIDDDGSQSVLKNPTMDYDGGFRGGGGGGGHRSAAASPTLFNNAHQGDNPTDSSSSSSSSSSSFPKPSGAGEVCSAYGGYYHLGNIPSGAWQAGCVLYGAGCVMLCVSSFLALSHLGLARDKHVHRVSLVAGYLQAIAGESCCFFI